ncbi:hypothetical protein [Streptomyces sp. NRRL B-24085]|nr:hypothetical protein [Streptomyces sp. NRRL B-24085]
MGARHKAHTAIPVEAARQRDRVGATRVRPRFRTPLEKELAEPTG